MAMASFVDLRQALLPPLPIPTIPASLQVAPHQAAPAGTTHLDMLAVMASSRQLDAPECDRALQGHLDGCLLHTILPIEGRVA